MKDTPRYIIIILLASLAVNVFIFGIWIGREYSGTHQGMRKPIDFNLRAISRTLPEEQQQMLRKALREYGPKMRQQAEAQRKLRLEIRSVIMAPTLDTEKLAELLARERAFFGQVRAPMHQAMLDILPKLPQSERLKWVAAIEAAQQRNRRKRR